MFLASTNRTVAKSAPRPFVLKRGRVESKFAVSNDYKSRLETMDRHTKKDMRLTTDIICIPPLESDMKIMILKNVIVVLVV